MEPPSLESQDLIISLEASWEFGVEGRDVFTLKGKESVECNEPVPLDDWLGASALCLFKDMDDTWSREYENSPTWTFPSQICTCIPPVTSQTLYRLSYQAVLNVNCPSEDWNQAPKQKH